MGVYREYDPLRRVAVCSPKHFIPTTITNEFQKRWFDDSPPEAGKLVEDHEHFVGLMEQHGVNVEKIPPHEGLIYQMYTRDTGFVVGEHHFQAQQVPEVRQPENAIMRSYLSDVNWEEASENGAGIEGGDVLRDWPLCLIGRSTRTTEKAALELKAKLQPEGWDVHLVKFNPAFLHLDTVMSFLPGKLIIDPAGLIEPLDPEITEGRAIITVERDEQEQLAPNLLPLNHNTVIVGDIFPKLRQSLEDHGITCHPSPVADFVKLGGAFRCLTLPLNREGSPN